MEFFTRYGTRYEGAVINADEAKGTAAYWVTNEPCHRCGGSGGWKHWPGFTCFRCGGRRIEEPSQVKLYSAEKLAKLNATAAKRDAKRMEKAQAEQAVHVAKVQTYREANADAVAAMERHQDNHFIADMLRKLEQFGSLTEAQLNAAQVTVGRLDAQAAAKAASGHVGTVGERVELVVKIDVVIALEAGAYGWAAPSIYLGRDQQGNRIVYKGTGEFGGKGDTVKVKATISEHGERNGELQTVIARPKVLGLLDEETGRWMRWDGPSGAMVVAQ